MSDQMYCIYWKCLVDGRTGHGLPMPLDEATTVCKQLHNQHMGYYDHWVESVTVEEKDQGSIDDAVAGLA